MKKPPPPSAPPPGENPRTGEPKRLSHGCPHSPVAGFRSDRLAAPDDGRWRRLALGGILGPAAFIGAWVVGSAVAVDYSPITDAISRLAAVGADTRVLMSAGFLGFSTASIPAAGAVRRAIPGSAWVGVVGTGLATAAVAALPLDRNPVIDAAHALAAGAGYALFVYAAAAAAKPLWEAGRRSLATISMCVAVLASAALVATPFVEASGLLQRIGLTSLDVWLATISALVLSGRLAIDPIG